MKSIKLTANSKNKQQTTNSFISRIIAVATCMVLAVVLGAGCVSVNFTGFDAVTGRGEFRGYTYTVSDFTKIETALYCDINYHYSTNTTVSLLIQPNLAELVTVKVIGDTLVVNTTQRISWSGAKAPILNVGTPVLEELSMAGAGMFIAHDIIAGESFAVSLAGAGQALAELDVNLFTANLAGAGSMELTGRADTAVLTLAGAGSIDALDLQVKDADIDIAGAGSVSIGCSDNLLARLNGVGSVEYRGNPSLDVRRNGIGSVSQVP